VVAAASYGGAIVYVQKKLRGLPPLVGPTAQLTTAAIFLIPLSLIVDRPFSLALPSWQAGGALLLLTIFSTALVFVLYYRAMEITNATTLSLATYMIPVVATIVGVVFLGERLEWYAYLGCVLIIAGVMGVNGPLQAIDWRRLAGTMAVKASTITK
jgi:drug/metabolite transporter (DMT)-like permease